MVANKVLRNGFYTLDLFQRQLPGFNVRGRSTIPSLAGVICSFLIMLVTLLYAGLKFDQMISRENPQISSYIERNVIPPDEEFHFAENGFFAFGVEGYVDGLPRDDPRYVKMFLRLVGRADGKTYEHLLSYRKCHSEDYADMVTSNPSSAALIEQYRTDPEKSLNCIDWSTLGKHIAIWGTQSKKDIF